MTEASDIKNDINVREGMEIRECGSLEEAVLWCYRHDFHPFAPWPESRRDRGFAMKVRFGLPLLEDYLQLILKDRTEVDIPSYARQLSARIADEEEAMERNPDGSFSDEGVREYIRRFRRSDFDADLRDYDISAYPFPPFDIDIYDIADDPPKYFTDERCRYLASRFEAFFPRACTLAASLKYPSHDDPDYTMHVKSMNFSIRHFAISNQAIPSVDKLKLRDGLERWVSWATTILRPRVVGEEF